MGKKGKGKHANYGKGNNKWEERRQKMEFRRKKNKHKYGDAEWNADFAKFQKQMELSGLTIKDVAGDGNCLFRAIADQMVDDPQQHADFRKKIMDFVEAQRDAFEPFVEDDIPFETYLSDMRKNGSWGGHIEVQAFSLLYQCNVIIHQLDQPRWEVNNHQIPKSTIHLSYHDGDHYASVRTLGGGHPPADVYTVAIETPKEADFVQPVNDLEKMIMEASGCTDVTQVRSICEDCQWNTDEAIAILMTMNDTAGAEEVVQNEIVQNIQPQRIVHNVQAEAQSKPSKEPIFQHVKQKLTNKERKLEARIQKKLDTHYAKKNNKGKQPKEEVVEPTVQVVTKDLGALCI